MNRILLFLFLASACLAQVIGAGAQIVTPSSSGSGCTPGGSAGQILVDDGAGDCTASGVTIDTTGGVAGAVMMPAGTAPTIPANVFGWKAGATMTTSVVLQSPNAAPAAHSVMVIGAPTSNVADWTYQAIPDCPTGGLGFTQSSDAFGCNSISGGSLPTTGYFFPFPWPPGEQNTAIGTTVKAFPFVMPYTATITGYGIRTASGGTAGNYIAFGIYDATGTGNGPGTLVTNSIARIQADVSNAGYRAAAGNVSLTAGTLYYFAEVAEDAGGTVFSVYSNNTDPWSLMQTTPGSNNAAYTCGNAATGSTTTFAPPNTCGTLTRANPTTPMIALMKQ